MNVILATKRLLPCSPSPLRRLLFVTLSLSNSPTRTARFPQPRLVEEGQSILSVDDKLEAVRHDPYAHPITTITTTTASSSTMYVGRTWRGELGRITSGEWKVLAAGSEEATGTSNRSERYTKSCNVCSDHRCFHK
jgi:hypothetical protein